MDKVKWRRDSTVAGDSAMHVVWAFRVPVSKSEYQEGLVMLYSMSRTADSSPTIYMPGMTHEVTVYTVAPETPIDFNRSLLEQKDVSPLTPHDIGFQFRAKSMADAVERIGDMVRRVVQLDVPPDVSSEWLPFFRDAVDISEPVVDTADAIEQLRAAPEPEPAIAKPR
jgi:hypothetical protein